MELLAAISDATALFMLWLFVASGLQKINPANATYFSELIVNFGWNNKSVAGVIIRIIGVIEIGTGIAIIVPSSRANAIFMAIALLFAYLAHMAFQLVQGHRDLDCGCGGPASQLKMSNHLLFRNAALIGLAFFCLAPGNTFQTSVWLLSVVVAMIGIVVHQSCEQLISNAQKLKTLRTY